MGVAATMRAWWRRREAGAAGARAAPGATAFAGLSTGAVREFFRYHGAMAPGVRLLRSLPMGAKIAVVAGAFVLPLTFGALGLVAQITSQVNHTRAQLAALTHWREASKVLGQLRLLQLEQVARRVQAPAPSAAAAPLAVDGLQPWHAANDPSARHSAGDWAHLRDALARVAAAADDPKARFEALLEASDALLAYSRWIGRGTLDREPDYPNSEHAEFATMHLPRLAVRLAAVADVAALSRATPGDEALRFQLRQGLLALERAHAEVVFVADRLADAGFPISSRLALDVAPFVESIHGKATGRMPEQAEGDLARALVADGLAAHEAARKLQAAALGELGERLGARLAQLQRERLTVWLLLLVLTAVPVYLLLALHRVMAGGMVKVIDEVRRMSTGDLSERPSAQGRDEVAGALNSLSSSLAMLADMFSHVRQGAAAVAHASGEIARGNTDLEQRTVQSREGLERVVDAVRACVALLDQCGRRVDDTVAVVDAMRLDAAKSRANMGALETRMHELRRKSGEIDAIVGLIDGIAFRTNILALNASIESSKAGEAGRGFSVVAQEVRRLAQRSADNARQISEIIGGAREDIERGAALADHTGADLKSTDQLVLQVHEAMRDVVQLTRQGQQRSEQILDEVRELMTLTEANGELVHQITNASQALSEQGGELSQRVESFKLT
jgi:methyl-accepting chemotaxis protein